ncbi:MAG: hypothetical protein HYR70_14410 [Chloroflexi bacterium]|nr:hypothetical protein [Chloroflexota bacterium]MBI3339826.1 hypothetical protein [Chloroflexota bacterium]
MKRLAWFEILLVIVFMTIQFYAAFSDANNFPSTWFIRDDAYYYFKVAQNISQGLGSTFDGINQTNGYHPLWMLVTIPVFALARFDLILPLRVLLIVLSGFSLGTAILLYRLISGAVSPPAGMLAAMYWLFSLYIKFVYYKTGLESGIALFFIVLFLYMIYKMEIGWRKMRPTLRQIAWLGLVATLATFSRLDLVFFAAVAGIWIVFRATPIRYLLPLDILAVIASVLTAFIARLGILGYYAVSTSAVIMILAGLVIKIPVFYFYNLYQRPANMKLSKTLQNIILATAISSGILIVLLLAGTALRILPTFSRAILLLDALFTLGFLLLIRAAAYVFRNPGASLEIIPPLDQLKEHWKDWLTEGSIYYGILGGLLSIYMLWNKLAFGVFSPVSGDIKRWWGTFAINVYGGPAKNLLSFLALNPQTDFSAWEPFATSLRDWSEKFLYQNQDLAYTPLRQQNFLIIVAVTLIIFCIFLLLRRKQSVRAVIQTGLIPLLAGSWLQILSYNITGYASLKEWYWLTEQIFSIIITIVLVNIFFDLVLNRWAITRFLMWALVAVYGFTLAFNYWEDTRLQMTYSPPPPGTPYVQVVPFLESHTQSGDVIGMTGGGNVGYFIRNRTIVNMDGLINSNEYFQALKNGTGSDYLYDKGMRYVFANPDILSANPYRGQYTNRLQPIIDWGGKDLMRLLPKPTQ